MPELSSADPLSQLMHYRSFTHVLILETFENDNPHPLRSGRITSHPEVIAKCR
jgi:hypothetical protein